MDKRVERKIFVLRAVWIALLGGVALYAAIIYAILGGLLGENPLGPIPPIDKGIGATLTLAAGIVAFGMFMTAKSAERFFFDTGRLAEGAKRRGKPLGEMSDDERFAFGYQLYFTTRIIQWALCETIGVFGLVIGLMTYNLDASLIFIAISLVTISLFPPSGHSLGELLSSLSRVT